MGTPCSRTMPLAVEAPFKYRGDALSQGLFGGKMLLTQAPQLIF